MSLDADMHVRRGRFEVHAHLVCAAGQRLVIVGPNGAGKSTLLLALAGLAPLTAGHIRLGGRTLRDATGVDVEPRRRNVGLVFQSGQLFPHMSVIDNVAFGPRARGSSKIAARERARSELERLDLLDLATRRPGHLSGGEAQRCALARALATDPDLLLLDEPFAALDVSSRVEVRRAVTKVLAASDVPVVVVTHDPIEAVALADRIIVLERGAVTQEGSPDEIRSRPRSKYVGDLVGMNVLRGEARGGILTLADGMTLTLANRADGDHIVTFHPHAVALFTARPAGSMRNVWEAEVRHVERLGDRVRIELDRPGAVTVEVTPAATDELALAPGVRVWASLKATEIEAFPA